VDESDDVDRFRELFDFRRMRLRDRTTPPGALMFLEAEETLRPSEQTVLFYLYTPDLPWREMTRDARC
jgi:hypothetical protein